MVVTVQSHGEHFFWNTGGLTATTMCQKVGHAVKILFLGP